MCTEDPTWRWSRADCLAGRGFWPDCPDCADRTHLDAYCRFCDGRAEEVYFESGGLRTWRRYADKSLSTLDWDWLGQQPTAHIRYLAERLPTDLVAGGEGLFLAGRAGSGKTHIGLGLCLLAVAYGHSVYAATLSEVLLLLRSAYEPGSALGEAELMEIFTGVDLLFLDDVSLTQPSPWAIDRLHHLVNVRYAQRRVTLLTSPFPPQHLTDLWGDALTSRIFDACPPLLLTKVGDYRQVERARRMPVPAHWPGTEAEIVVGGEE